LRTSKTSETLETYTCNMRFQQNLEAKRVEHCTAGSGCAIVVENEDDSGRVAVRPPLSGGAAPDDICT
jgi:hypothetical protein